MKKRGTLRWQFFTSTISTTMVLLMLGVLVLFVLTAREIRNYVQQDLTMTVVLTNGTSPEVAHELEGQLSQERYVHNILYISSEQALQEQIDAMGIDPRELLKKNPFSISMELKMKAPYVCSDSLQWIAQEIRENENVADVFYPQELVEDLNSNLRTITIILLVITAMMVIISLSLINSTVHLSVYSRRFVINNMKLIGASWGFIRRPFMLRSLGIGLLSALIANGILVGLLHWMTRFDHAIMQFLPHQNILYMVASVLVFALVITLICTFISVTHFLRMREPDLYK